MRIAIKFIIPLITIFSHPFQSHSQQLKDGWYKQSDSLQRAGKHVKAIEILQNAATFYRESDRALYAKAVVKQGQILIRVRENKEALTLFDEVEKEVESGNQKTYIQLLTQKGFALSNMRRLTESREYLEKARELIISDSLNHYLMSYIEAELMAQNVQNGRTDLAMEHVESAISHAKNSENEEALRNAYNKAAMLNWRMNNHDKSLEYLQKEEEIVEKNYGSTSPQMASILRNMAVVASSGNEIEKAIFLVQRGLNLIQKDKNPRTYFLSHSSLSNYYNQLGEYQKALTYTDTALNVALEYKMEDAFLIETMVYRLTSLRNLQYFDKLMIEIQYLLDIEERNDLPFIKEANIYRSISTSYSKMENYKLSALYIRKAIDLVKGTYGPQTRYLNDLLVEFASIEMKMGHYDEALSIVNEVLMNASGEIDQKDKKFSSVTLDEVFAAALLKKADILFKKSNSKNIELLNNSIELLDLATNFINKKRQDISGEAFGASIRQTIKEQAIEYLYSLYSLTNDEKYLMKAVNYSEIARSDQLMVWLMEAEKFGQVGLGGDNYESRKSIKQSIDMFELMLSRLDKSDSSRVIQLNDTLRILGSSYDKVNLSVKKENAQFYATLYEDGILSIKDFDNFKTKEETTIIFNESAGNWYAVILGTSHHFIKIKGEVPDLEEFRSALLSINDTSFEEKSKDLFQYFVAPALPFVSTNRINFITDKTLSFVPLELLMDENGKYMFEKFDVRYSYTLSSKLDIKGPSSFKLLAVAPDFTKGVQKSDPIRSELQNIPGADKEVKEVSSLFNSKTLVGEEASEENFRSIASEFGIIHLATHAIIDDNEPKNSKLVFQKANSDPKEIDSYLHAYEIYNLNLNAQLVTLSACNTGFGKLQKGEGVMSLSRAFAYAGVPATVVSLWPASDKSTPELMKHFYQNLKDGQTKDVALNNARKQYLSTAVGKARHPFYWGGFVLIGDNSPLEEDRNLLVFILPITIILVLIGTILQRKRKLKLRQ